MDDVLLEVRRIREAYAKQFNYDLQSIHRDLKKQEQASGRRIVSLPARRPKSTTPHGESARAPEASPEYRGDVLDCRTTGSS